MACITLFFFFLYKALNCNHQTNEIGLQLRWQKQRARNYPLQSAWINSSKTGGETPTQTWEASLTLAIWASSWATLLYSLSKCLIFQLEKELNKARIPQYKWPRLPSTNFALISLTVDAEIGRAHVWTPITV